MFNGDILKQLRLLYGMTRKELAIKLDITEQAIWQFEKNEISPKTSVKLKMNPIRSELEGKSIVLVDDSIVRGTTSKSLVKVLREAGVKEIHLRIGSPPIISPCYYGIAMATKKELIAADQAVEEIRKTLGVDSLGYLSIESLVKCIGIEGDNLCLGCLTGDYPTELPANLDEYESCRC